jgi:hypothetical protein
MVTFDDFIRWLEAVSRRQAVASAA